MTSQNRNRWGILIVFMTAHATVDGFIWIIPPLLPSIREHFHLSYTEMGAFSTLFQFWGDVLQAPVAYLVYLAPTSVIMAGGILWSSVGMFLTSLSTSYGMLIWISVISGIGRATYHPLAVAMLSRVFGSDSLGRAMALHLSGSSMGQVFAPFLRTADQLCWVATSSSGMVHAGHIDQFEHILFHETPKRGSSSKG